MPKQIIRSAGVGIVVVGPKGVRVATEVREHRVVRRVTRRWARPASFGVGERLKAQAEGKLPQGQEVFPIARFVVHLDHRDRAALTVHGAFEVGC